MIAVAVRVDDLFDGLICQLAKRREDIRSGTGAFRSVDDRDRRLTLDHMLGGGGKSDRSPNTRRKRHHMFFELRFVVVDQTVIGH